MTALLTTISAIIQIFPLVVELVRTIEQAMPLKGAGAQKLDLLKGILEDAYQTMTSEDKKAVSLDRLVLAAVSIANRLVGYFNTTAVFPKTTS